MGIGTTGAATAPAASHFEQRHTDIGTKSLGPFPLDYANMRSDNTFSIFHIFSPVTVWADLVAWTESCHVESFVCIVDKGRRHGAQRNASVSQKIRYHFAIQTNLGHTVSRFTHSGWAE